MITQSTVVTRTTIHIQASVVPVSPETSVRVIRAIPTTLHSTTRTGFRAATCRVRWT